MLKLSIKNIKIKDSRKNKNIKVKWVKKNCELQINELRDILFTFSSAASSLKLSYDTIAIELDLKDFVFEEYGNLFKFFTFEF